MGVQSSRSRRFYCDLCGHRRTPNYLLLQVPKSAHKSLLGPVEGTANFRRPRFGLIRLWAQVARQSAIYETLVAIPLSISRTLKSTKIRGVPSDLF